jgi:hypothetical protein
VRWLVIGSCLALTACGTPPRPAAQPGPLLHPSTPAHPTARSASGVPGRASDAPAATPLPGGFRWPSAPRGWSPADERPSWLPDLPANPERYPEPRDWYRDSIAALQAGSPR